MYRILLVDDEITILEGLKLLIDWDSLGLQIADKASSAEAAWRLLETGAFDILIADIQMPGMDGLALIRKVRTAGFNIKVVILSGFDYFSYARQALELDAEYYFLKPVDEEELFLVMKSLVEKLDMENGKRMETARAMESLQRDTLYRWITGRLKPPVYPELRKALHREIEDECLLVCIINGIGGSPMPSAYAVGEMAVNWDALIDVNIQNIKVECPNGDVAVVFCGSSDTVLMEHAQAVLQSMVCSADTIKAGVFCTIGNIVHGCDNAEESYANAAGLLKYKASMPPGGIVVHGIETEPANIPAAWENNPFIKRVVNFIKSNYRDDITLKTMANTFRINPAYFGQVFKAETGYFFTDYLSMLRVEKVKRLLCFSNLSNAQIALEVGFASPEYMNKVFKKSTGMTLTDYKHMGSN